MISLKRDGSSLSEDSMASITHELSFITISSSSTGVLPYSSGADYGSLDYMASVTVFTDKRGSRTPEDVSAF